MDWRYHVTTMYDPASRELRLQENGIAQFPGTEAEWKFFITESKKLALYWMGMEYDIFPKRRENGTMTTDLRPSEREEERIKRDQENFQSWMVE